MKLIFSDIKFIVRKPLLLTWLLSPAIFTIFLLYFFSSITGLTRSDNAFLYDRHYTLTAITLIAGIPFIYGHLFSFIHLKELNFAITSGSEVRVPLTRTTFLKRMAASTVLSFIIVLPVIYVTGAVSTEGWLRSIYAAFLLAITAPFVFAFSACYARDMKSWKIISLISLIFLIALPSGLLLHHPWNYFMFLSPYYWTGWAWVIASPSESVLYGAISVALTTIFSLICFRFILNRSGKD
jgi:hypothetical protein